MLFGLGKAVTCQLKGEFPLSRKILRAFYVRKKHARKQFPLLRKIILTLRCLFTYVYVRFRPTNALGSGLKTKRAGKFDLSGKKKMAAAVNKRLLLLFYLRHRRERKQRYRKKYWIRDIFLLAVFYLQNTTR